jgi:hypothetical protein
MDFRMGRLTPNGPLSGPPGRPIVRQMKKRITAAILWFYAGWFAGAATAFVLGLTPALGPILGTAAAAIVAGDPRHIIWSRAATSNRGLEPA